MNKGAIGFFLIISIILLVVGYKVKKGQMKNERDPKPFMIPGWIFLALAILGILQRVSDI